MCGEDLEESERRLRFDVGVDVKLDVDVDVLAEVEVREQRGGYRIVGRLEDERAEVRERH